MYALKMLLMQHSIMLGMCALFRVCSNVQPTAQFSIHFVQ